MTIDTSGNVGIGTTAPASALHVSGAVQLGNDSAACSSTKVGALRWEPTWGLQVCQVNKDKAGLVGYAWAVARSRPVIWSGGCNYQSRGSGWDTYCANGEDFNNISDYLGVNTNGNFTVKISGYYRINMWADQHGCGHKRVNFVHNDTSRAYSHHYESTYAWDLNINDLVWPMRKDDTFYLQLHHDGGCDPYRWHSWNVNGHHSRLQVEYLGPLE